MEKLNRIAAVDIGTNTVRLLVVEVGKNKRDWSILHQAMEITRLGQGSKYTDYGSSRGKLSNEAAARTLEVISEYAAKAKELQSEKIRLVATSAVREASNGSEFAQMVFAKTSIPLDVVSGEEEARLSLAGVTLAVEDVEVILVLDIGGGSTELIFSRDGNIVKAKSIPVGAVSVTESFFHNDPPNTSEISNICTFLEKNMFGYEEFKGTISSPLVGTAGTITTLAAISLEMKKYDPEKINGFVLNLEEVKNILKRFMNCSLNERQKITGLEPKRADVIIGGTKILISVMERFGYERLVVSDFGLREGIIVDLLDKL